MKTADSDKVPTRRFRRRLTAAHVAFLLAALAGNVHAARLNYQIELSGLYSDNIDLSEDDEVSETVLIPRLLFDFKEEGSRVEVEARGHSPLYEALGIKEMILLCAVGPAAHAEVLNTLRLFGEQVIPHFRAKEKREAAE